MQTPIMKKLRSCNTRFCQKSSKRLTSMAILLATLVTLNSEATLMKKYYEVFLTRTHIGYCTDCNHERTIGSHRGNDHARLKSSNTVREYLEASPRGSCKCRCGSHRRKSTRSWNENWVEKNYNSTETVAHVEMTAMRRVRSSVWKSGIPTCRDSAGEEECSEPWTGRHSRLLFQWTPVPTLYKLGPVLPTFSGEPVVSPRVSRSENLCTRSSAHSNVWM